MSTKIPYCDETLEVTGGCTKCSLGCENCWAIKEVWRMAPNPLLKDKWKGLVEKKNGIFNWTGKIKLFPETLADKRLLSQKPKTFFVDSKCDLFHEKVPFWFIQLVIETIRGVPQHSLLVLTKRVKRAADFFEFDREHQGYASRLYDIPNNIHLGVTICNQAEADEKIPILLQIPTAHRWLSIEPMLDAVFIRRFLDRIGLIVVGCESGPKRRECKPEWIKSIVNQCKPASVKCFVKQMEVNGKVVHDLKDMPDWAKQELI